MKVGRASLKSTALVVGCLALFLDTAWASPGEASRRATGVVVVEGETVSPEAVTPELRPGDVVLSWESLPSPADDGARGGEIAGAVDWLWLVREEVPRGPVRLLGSRDGEPLVVDVRSGELTPSVRPVIDAPTLERYRSAPPDVQPAAWAALAAEASAAGNWQLAWWLLTESARLHAERRDWDQAAEAHRLAAAVAESSPEVAPTQAASVRADAHLARALLLAGKRASDSAIEAFQEAQTAAERGLGESLSLARVLQERGQFHAARGQIAEAQSLLEGSLAVAEAVAPDSVPVGISLRALAQLHSRKGELEAAEAAVSRALAIHERLTPGSLTLAESLGVRGTVVAQRGHLQTATELMERAAAIQERLAPGSLMLSRTWNNLGIQAWLRGDLATAESYYTRSLALKETLAPEDPSLASSLNNLGVVASQRGDLAAAEGYFERALAIWEARAPNSPEIGSSLANLATVAEQRGDLERARHYSKRGLRYYEQRAPGSDEVAGALANLATSEMTRGNLDAAAELFERAHAIAIQAAPEGPRVARIQHNRGSLASRRGDFATAEALYQQALGLKERLAPESLEVGETLAGLGDVAMRRGDLATAEVYFRRALALVERWAPDGVDAAELWSALGTIETHSRRKRRGSALPLDRGRQARATGREARGKRNDEVDLPRQVPAQLPRADRGPARARPWRRGLSRARTFPRARPAGDARRTRVGACAGPAGRARRRTAHPQHRSRSGGVTAIGGGRPRRCNQGRGAAGAASRNRAAPSRAAGTHRQGFTPRRRARLPPAADAR
jgi:tetratricopeptide (TPR) repeat protein